jgi:hypothetical protein
MFVVPRPVREPSLSGEIEENSQVSYLMWMPETARAITSLWISEVPSKIV